LRTTGVSEGAKSPVGTVSTASVAAVHETLLEGAIHAAPSAGTEFNRVRPLLVPKACYRLEDSHFEFDSSFILPMGMTFDAAPLKNLLDQHPGCKLAIFGHADPVGDDDYNKILSGRRAQSVYGLLVRDVKLWEELYYRHDTRGKDRWGVRSVQIMLNRVGPTKTGSVDGTLTPGTKQALADFEAKEGLGNKGFDKKEEIAPATFQKLASLYMDAICTDDDSKDFRLKPTDFLAKGSGRDGKGDYQGCSEFNPLMLFSKTEKARLDRKENHEARNKENQVNRRIMILLFRAGSRVDPARWPCPSVKEGISGCKKRFFSDGDVRRANRDKRSTQEETEHDPDTKGIFACRFYERITKRSPCNLITKDFQIRLYDPQGVTIAGAPYRATIGTQVSTATADSEGFANLRNLEVPAECVIEWGLPDPQADPQRPPVYLFKLEMLLDVEREQELMDTAREQDCKKRLNNLGYVISEDTKKNVAAFQNDFQQKYHLRTDGELDDKTMDAIEDVYDKCAKNLRE
jgi:hypothetical protein